MSCVIVLFLTAWNKTLRVLVPFYAVGHAHTLLQKTFIFVKI